MIKIHSIKFKLTLILISMMLVAFLFQFFYLGPGFEKREIDTAKEYLISTSFNITADFDLNFRNAAEELVAMAALPDMNTLEKEKLDRMIVTFNASNTFFNHFFVMDRNGTWISFPTQPVQVGTRIPEKNMYWVEQTFARSSVTFLDVVQSVTGTLVSGFSTPIQSEGKEASTLLRGVFVISDDNSLVNAIKNLRIGSHSYAYLVASNGWLLVHPEKELRYENFQAYSMLDYEPVKCALRGGNGITEYMYEGEKWLAAYNQIPLTGWGLIVQQKMSDIIRNAQSGSRIVNLLIFGIFLFVFLSVIFVINRSLKPLSDLVDQIKSGATTKRTTNAKDEIGELTYHYNKLYNSLYQLNEKTKKSESRFRALFNNANDAIFFHDLSGNIIEVNRVACDRLGYSREELITMNIASIDSPASRPFIEKRIKQLEDKGSILFEEENMNRNGKVIPVEINSRIIELDDHKAVLSIVRDLTERKEAEKERKKLEQQFLQAQKMESLATLAAGFAHDFNNILMGIQANATLLQSTLSCNNSDNIRVKDIEELVRRGISLTRQLLALGRGGKYEIEVIDVNDLLNKSATLFGRTRKEIRIHYNLDSKLWSVEADRGQIEQVFFNLYVNAWQAMPKGGNIYLSTANVILEEEYGRHYAIPPGPYVKISITDTGEGIDEAIRQKIFDPFFTTKKPGVGSGLGLASSYGIIRNHNGNIAVYSEKGKGTTFTIYLPATLKEARTVEDVNRDMPKGDETILLVDDEEMIIKAGKEFLSILGYTVITALSGKDAIEMYKREKDRIALVILDMIMPDMGGNDTFIELKKNNPGIKVLLSSGYSINGQARGLLEQGCSGFIQKPFSIAEVAKKIRVILDSQ